MPDAHDATRLAAPLRAAAAALGVPLDITAENRLLAYLSLLQRWNGVYNLTAVRNADQMLTQHLADCLAVVPPLVRRMSGTTPTILDVGSGGGLPGVVLAVLMPNADVTCVDAVGKKAAFIRQVAGELRLPNLHAEHERAERLQGRFDVITSRAFATLSLFTSLTRQALAEQGIWMAMKGKAPDDEIAELPADIDVFHVEQLEVPGLNADRCLVWMRQRTAQ